jgi:hypothetical protein
MARIVDEVQVRVGQALDVLVADVEGEELVVLSPHDRRRHGHTGEQVFIAYQPKALDLFLLAQRFISSSHFFLKIGKDFRFFQ